MIVGASGITVNETANQCAPREGPKAVAVPLDFTAVASIDLDYSMLQEGNFSQLQGFYVDNSASAVPLTINILSTRQSITVKGHTQGYYTALSQNPIRLNFQSAGGVRLGVWMLNFPVAVAQWATQ